MGGGSGGHVQLRADFLPAWSAGRPAAHFRRRPCRRHRIDRRRITGGDLLHLSCRRERLDARHFPCGALPLRHLGGGFAGLQSTHAFLRLAAEVEKQVLSGSDSCFAVIGGCWQDSASGGYTLALLRTFNQIDGSTTSSRLAATLPTVHKKCFKDELQQAAQSWFVTLRISDWESPSIGRLPRVEV